MRKALTFLGASLCLAWVVPAMAQTDAAFKDVPTEHWAYQSVEALRAKGILIGYPDGLYRGKRTLTRYEFAVALKRALDTIQGIKGDKGDPGAPGPAGPAGDKGEAGPQGPSGVAPEDLATLKRLADEFKAELASQGVNVAAVTAKLDKMARDMAELKAAIAGLPRLTGGAFFGIRSDRAAGGYVDYGGRPMFAHSGSDSLVNQAAVLHVLDLGITAKVGSDATAVAKIVTGNYNGYLGNMTSVGLQGPLDISEPWQQWYVDQLNLTAPFGAVGRGGNVVMGRFGMQLTPMTLWKPVVDPYFNVPQVNDGLIRMDGFKLATGIGSLGVTAFAGRTASVTDQWGDAFQSPAAGVASAAIFNSGEKPHGGAYMGQMLVTQLGGLRVQLPVKVGEGSHVGATAFLANGTGGAGFTNVQVVGADTLLKFSDRVQFSGDWTKTIEGRGRLGTVNPYQNSAFNGMVGYKTGQLAVSAGYRYVDPFFYAPGYWGRIGNWLNPTNIQGPTFTAAYNFSPVLGLNVGGDFLSAARDWAGRGGLGRDDDIHRVLVGLKWDVSKSFQTTIDWEGVYWNLGTQFDAPSGTRIHPVEHYITLGTGYHVNDATLLKLAWQIGGFNGKLLDGCSVYGVGPTYNFNVFTSQVAIKF